MRTVTEVLRWAAACHPERDAYVHGSSRLTYRDLDRAAAGFATALRDRGVAPGDVVCLMLPSSIEFAACYLGAIRARAITSAVNGRLGAREQASIVARTEPRVTVVGSGITPPDGSGLNVRVDELSRLFGEEPMALDDAIDEHETVAIVWTSGTTGAPKGAMYDHAALRANHEGMGDLCHPGDRRLVSLPFAHMGYMTRAWNDLANAVTMVLIGEPWSAAEHIRLIEAERITMVTGVPTQWSLVVGSERLLEVDRSSLRLAGIGASAVPPELVRAMRASLGCEVMTRYTSTEAGLISGTQLGDPDEVVATTVGIPSPIVSLKLNNQEILVKSPAMFTGYWREPELTAAAIDADGYLRTGDLGSIDSDGNLRLVGRLKDMYIRGGYNVYPTEVEGVIAEHPAVVAVSVVGAPTPVLGELGVAFVVPADPAAPPCLEELREWCKARLADYKSPDRLIVVDELPITGMHKIDKAALVERAKELETS